MEPQRAVPDRRSRGGVPQSCQQPRDEDALDRHCARCGSPGPPHLSADECIDALRSCLADATGGEIRARR